MNILVQPTAKQSSSDSCKYTCPVYNTGTEGLKKLMKKFVKKKHKHGKTKGRVCWYGN